MKTFPDFTWEWIIANCESYSKYFQNRTNHETIDWAERQRSVIQTAQGIIAIVPKLREHPQLEKLVPMKSLLSLRWFPSKDYEIELHYEENQSQYSITIIKSGSGLFDSKNVEQKLVMFDEVANEVYAYVAKLQVD